MLTLIIIITLLGICYILRAEIISLVKAFLAEANDKRD